MNYFLDSPRFTRNKVINRVRSELLLRISKGYGNIDINSVELEVDKILKEIGVV